MSRLLWTTQLYSGEKISPIEVAQELAADLIPVMGFEKNLNIKHKRIFLKL
jgi:hypothetical protein